MADTWIWKKDRFVAEVHRSVFSASRADFGSSSSRTRRKLEYHLCLSPRDLARLGFRLAFSPSSPVWEKKWRDIDIEIFVSQVKGCGNCCHFGNFGFPASRQQMRRNHDTCTYSYISFIWIYMICNTSSSLECMLSSSVSLETPCFGVLQFWARPALCKKETSWGQVTHIHWKIVLCSPSSTFCLPNHRPLQKHCRAASQHGAKASAVSAQLDFQSVVLPEIWPTSCRI